MPPVYLIAEESNLGEVLDLDVVRGYLGEGEVWHLGRAAHDFSYRHRLLRRIRGLVPVVAGGGTLMTYFESFWEALPPQQRLLFVGTGVCWRYERFNAIQIDPMHVDPRSRFRGPLLPLGFSHRDCVLPPGILYKLPQVSPDYVLSVVHPNLVDESCHHRFAEAVARDLGMDCVRSANRTSDLPLYEKAALVITSRLHAAVLAAGNGIPCFVLSRDHKIDWFCQQVGMAHASLPAMHFNKLPQQVVHMAAEAKGVQVDLQCQTLRNYLQELTLSSRV